MKVVAAIDSFKGSLTSMEAGLAAREGIRRAHPGAEVIVKPLADGGEGTADALMEGLGGEKVYVDVTGPLGRPVKACYGYIKETKTAVIEMAAAAGLTLEEEKDPLRATTRGVGEMMLDAIEKGCRDFVIGLGGSATNDGGIGMLQALGYEFYDENGYPAGEGGQALEKISAVSTCHAAAVLKECRFRVACDVTNPLCGPQGAAYIYGSQKGVTEAQKGPLDRAMKHYAEVTKKYMHNDYVDTPGAGAAGGMGFAFLSYLCADLQPGVDVILDAIGLEKDVCDADVVVTGEGCLDRQTAMGKAPAGVAKLAKKYGVKVIAFAGTVTEDAGKCNDVGIDAFFPIVRGITTLEEAMDPAQARKNLSAAAEQVFRLL